MCACRCTCCSGCNNPLVTCVGGWGGSQSICSPQMPLPSHRILWQIIGLIFFLLAAIDLKQMAWLGTLLEFMQPEPVHEIFRSGGGACLSLPCTFSRARARRRALARTHTAFACVVACVCVCERERERERERARVCVGVWVCIRERESLGVGVCCIVYALVGQRRGTWCLHTRHALSHTHTHTHTHTHRSTRVQRGPDAHTCCSLCPLFV